MRVLLIVLLVAATGCAAPVRTVDAPPGQYVDRPGGEAGGLSMGAADTLALAAGPMLADVTMREATVWVQTAARGFVRLEVTPDGRPGATFTPPGLATAPDGTAAIRLSGLEPGTRYTYRVLVDGYPAGIPYATAFTTQPLWQYRTDPPAFTVAIGSCHYDNDAFARPGTPYGGSTAIFEAIRAQSPDVMLWLGDNAYMRETDWWSPDGIAYRYAHARATHDLQPLLAGAVHYATWDDHDYGPNDSDRSYVHKGAALDVFRRYWPNPTHGVPGAPGAITQFQWGDAEFFLLDDRTYRSPNRAPAPRTILGETQLAWLLDALTASRAPFKVVAMGGQVVNPSEVFETYANVAPEERQRLFDEITARRIDGVVFLSGDRHMTELDRLERPGTYPLYDFTSSPLTAGTVTSPPDSVNVTRVPGTLVTGQRNFGTLTFTGPRTDRTLTMRTFSAEGALLWEHPVRAADLATPE